MSGRWGRVRHPDPVFNGPSLDDPQSVSRSGFVGSTPDEVRSGLAAGAPSEHIRDERIDTVIESTELRAIDDARTEHDFTSDPRRTPDRLGRQPARRLT